MPNAESALNEEAGKLLLEHYDDYSQRAKMMTEIHAQVFFYYYYIITSKELGIFFLYEQPQKYSKCGTSEGPMAKKHAGDKKLTAEKKKLMKDKKRTLKRL